MVQTVSSHCFGYLVSSLHRTRWVRAGIEYDPAKCTLDRCSNIHRRKSAIFVSGFVMRIARSDAYGTPKHWQHCQQISNQSSAILKINDRAV
ncbi:MAG: hypothetical protein A2792_09135 [Sphingomonadales bacterium RIFCSPHIGHO2_01_FULL_65_20]|nr:MAG: hypothetical protein A2792_09135 [Sphingomonadales bacterium RIFCSPHIGHO2_01_FULL_65_20]